VKGWEVVSTICEISISQYLAHMNMESTSESSTSSVVSTARTPFRRGMSLKAAVAKTAGWTLEKYKDVTLPEIKECKQT
jgi:hypothetical protein